LTLLALPLVALPAGLAGWTALGSARVEARFPPEGRLVPVGEHAIHVVERGAPDAPALVLIHGASGNFRDLDEPLGARLAQRWRVVLVDRPGHGSSTRPETREAGSPDAQARMIAAALRSVGVERAVVVGHSFGTAVAVALALEAPELVRGLVLVAPATHPWGGGGVSWHNRFVAGTPLGWAFSWILPYPVGTLTIDHILPAVFRPNPVPDGYAERIGARLVLRPAAFRANARDVADLLGHVERLQPRYAEIAAPALVVAGAHDPIVRNDIHVTGLLRDLRFARAVTLDTGHMPHWGESARLTEEIDSFAGGLAP
jgi:pimeloyl-ACP methyl ester carboxylesterase